MKNSGIILIAISLLLLVSCTKEDETSYKNADGFDLYSTTGITGTSGNTQGNPAIPGDKYTELEENPFIMVTEAPVSTFSIDADGASYSNIRRFILQDHQLPPRGAVRTEEMINYFDFNYDYQPSAHPISLNGEVSSCPWEENNRLVRIGIQGKSIPESQLPPSNFVLLIDVSGSMSSPDKLALLKQGFTLFVDQMRNEDRIAIVTYAGNAGLVLESTLGNEKVKIRNAIASLGSGGSTAGAEGILTAYQIARENLIEGGNNRIILGTDGDFNVGVSSKEELIALIETQRDFGIFLTVLGVGRGNYNDAALEQIADNGNGNFEYIDKVDQLKKVFIHEFERFYTIAKDVKVQVEFNPEIVEAYRLIGYENRVLNTEDFEDDKKDAGEIGAGQNITALYEIIPKQGIDIRQSPAFTIDFRYKNPDEDISIPMQLEIFDEGKSFTDASDQMIFSSSIAEFSMLITNSKFKGNSNYLHAYLMVEKLNLPDPYGYIEEFKKIVNRAKQF